MRGGRIKSGGVEGGPPAEAGVTTTGSPPIALATSGGGKGGISTVRVWPGCIEAGGMRPDSDAT
jgi:hypothetical protein